MKWCLHFSLKNFEINHGRPKLVQLRVFSASQVELWNGSKITWPDRVAIVGYGVKGVGKGGKAGWTFLTLDL